MEEISRLFDTVLNIDFIRAVISNPREKDGIIKVSGKGRVKRAVSGICRAVQADTD